MADFISVDIKGLEEITAALRLLPERIAANALRGAVRAGAEVIKAEAILRAPVWTGPMAEGHPPPGTLKRAIYSRYMYELSSKTQAVQRVTVRKGRPRSKREGSLPDAYYWTWVEFGHWWVPKAGTTRRARRLGVLASQLGAKWIPAHPFMRPAYEAKREAAVHAFAQYLAERVPKEVAKIAVRRMAR